MSNDEMMEKDEKRERALRAAGQICSNFGGTVSPEELGTVLGGKLYRAHCEGQVNLRSAD